MIKLYSLPLFKLKNIHVAVSSWKLSRTKTLAPEYSAVIDDVVKNTQGLLEDYYSRTSQTDADCFYVPEYVPNQDVVFRGQCAEVTGVQGFDVTKVCFFPFDLKILVHSTLAP